MQYYVDGSLVPAAAASVPVTDRGFQYGDAAFETLRAYGGSIFEWERHVDRLLETCRVLGFDPGHTPAELGAIVQETLVVNELEDAYVRLSVTRGSQPGTLTPAAAADPRVVVIVSELPPGGSTGDSVWAGPATVAVAETRRVPNEAIPARAKTHNYLNGILARLELRGSETDEAILLDANGFVTEGATSNLFFVRDGTLFTPGLDGPVLPGVTRAVVMEIADDRGIPVETGCYDVAAVRNADEVFLTNTTWEVRPVARFDGNPFETGPVTRSLATAFDEYVDHRHYE